MSDPKQLKLEAIEKRVREVLMQQLEVLDADLKPEAMIVADLRADSLTVIELALALEQEFKITISDDDLEGLRTVGNLITYVQEKAA